MQHIPAPSKPSIRILAGVSELKASNIEYNLLKNRPIITADFLIPLQICGLRSVALYIPSLMQVIFKRVKRLVLVSSTCFCMTTLFANTAQVVIGYC